MQEQFNFFFKNIQSIFAPRLKNENHQKIIFEIYLTIENLLLSLKTKFYLKPILNF
jgi:hypothetical protein